MATQDQPFLGDRRNPKCPACRAQAARFKHPDAPVPVKELIALGLIILTNVLPISIVFPFLYFMIEDLHIAKNTEDIGYYAGWIGSSFMFGRFVTGLFWGVVADKYGRKRVMYCGIISVVVFNTLFGLSTNFYMALVSRFLLGSFNGVLGTVKAYASEICKEEHQAIGLSLVSTVWGFALIVGPALGGFLAQPALKYPSIFKPGTLFDRFPYLLQALAVLVFVIPALIMCFYLPETLHMNHTEDDEEIAVPEKDDTSEDEHVTPSSIFKSWSFMSATLVYCVWSLHDIAYTEIFSLWANSPKSYGGLSFTSSDVGQVLAISGSAVLIFQLTIFPPIATRVGPILVTRIPSLLTVPLLTIYPFFTYLKGIGLHVVVSAASIVKYLLGVRAETGVYNKLCPFVQQATFTGCFLLINNSIRQNQRGAANGFSLSVVSIFKAIGPAGGGSVFAWSQTRQDTWFLPGDHFVFFFLSAFALLAAILTFHPILPRSVNKPMVE